MVVYELGELCTWAKGASIPREETDSSKSCAYLHYGDLYKKYDFRLNLEDKYLEIIKIDDISKIKSEQYLRSGDIVFALTSETVEDLGHCTLIINSMEKSFVSGMETTVIHINNQKEVIPAYLNYFFHSDYFQKQLRQYVTGMKVYRVHPKDLMKLKIDLPEYAVQKLVVSVLDGFSDKILLNSKINDNLLIQCKAQYHQLLRKSESTVLLSDLAEVCYGKDHKSLNDGKIPVYGSGGVMRYAEKALYSGKESVLIPRKGSLNNIMYVCEPFWSVDTMFYTKMKNEWVGKYLYFFLAEYDLAGMNIGSAVPSMTTELLNAIEIPYPGDIVLKSFDHTIQPLFNQIWLNKKECTHLASIRDSILPKLLSGEIDVSSLRESQLNNHLSQNQGESI